MDYKIDDKNLDVSMFISFVNQVWQGNYDVEQTRMALSKTLNITAYRKDSIFYETCRLGTACSARCPQMASPQKGSWRQPAQGCKTSGGRLPCTDRSGAETA